MTATRPGPVENDVFISFTHKHGSGPAHALHKHLGDDVAFLDDKDIRHGEDFVDRLLDGILHARVAVLFIDDTYFDRPYCWFEYVVATTAYRTLQARGAGTDELARALEHLVVVLPPDASPELISKLPPPLQTKNWARANHPGKLAAQVDERRPRNDPYLDRLTSLIDREPGAVRAALKDLCLPRPRPVPDKRSYSRAEARPRSLDMELHGRREELSRIHHELTASQDGAARTVALIGGAGVGKTTLAAEYVYRFSREHDRDNYPGGVFWVRADLGRECLREQFYGILCKLHKEPPSWETVKDQKMTEVRHQLGAALQRVARTKRILYVVDSVPEPTTTGAAPTSFRTWCPEPESVSLIVTTRVRRDFEAATEIPVKLLSPTDARSVILKGIHDAEGPSQSEWDTITAWVGRIPLALVLLNRLLKGGGASPRELLAKARAMAPPATDLRDAAKISGEEDLIKAIELSYDGLPPEAQRAARLIAQLSPSPVPWELFEGVVLSGVRSASARLNERSFLTRNNGNGGLETVGAMPPVIAATMLELSDHSEEELVGVCRALLTVMSPEDCRAPTKWKLLDECRPHARHLFDRVARQADRWQPATRAAAASLGLRAAALLRSQGRLSAAEQSARGAEALSLSGTRSPTPQTLAASSVRAAIWQAQGRLDAARDLQAKIVTRSQQHPQLGPDHPDTLAYEAQLAGTMAAVGELAEACRRLERVVAVSSSSAGCSRLDTLSYQQQLAVALASMGRYEEACQMQAEVVRAGAEVLSTGDGQGLRAADVLTSWHEEGGTTPSFDHPWLLRSRANLASLYVQIGDLEQAYTLQREVVSEASQLRCDHPDRLEYEMLLLKITAARATLDDASKPEALDLAAHMIADMAPKPCSGSDLGPQDREPLMVGLHRDLGFVYHQLGDLESARQQLETALSMVPSTARRADRTLIAWSLFVVLEQLGRDEAGAVRRQHLDWLVDAPIETLDETERDIRAQLVDDAVDIR